MLRGPFVHARSEPCGRLRGINLRKRPSLSVGARVDDVAWGGPLWSPASPFHSLKSRTRATLPSPAGDHKGPPCHPTPPSPLRLNQPPLLRVMHTGDPSCSPKKHQRVTLSRREGSVSLTIASLL